MTKEEQKADELIEIYPYDLDKRIRSCDRMINLYKRRCNLDGVKYWQSVKQHILNKGK